MLETCPDCTARFAVGLLRCPQCQAPAPRFADRMKEDTVPRITVAGGPSNPDAAPGETGYIAPEGSEDVSAGTRSSTSSEKEPNSPEPSKKQAPSRARTTASRSKKAPTETSTASGTAGDQTDATSETGSAAEGGEG